MPLPSIPAFADLTFTVGIYGGFTLTVGNSPAAAFGITDFDGFEIYLVGSTIWIIGTPTRAGRYQLRLHAGNVDGWVFRDGNIVVNEPYAPPPVVRTPFVQMPARIDIDARRNIDYTTSPINIPISNNPSSVRVIGVAIGMGWRFYSGGIQLIGRPMDRRTGILPSALTVIASNSAGSHTGSAPLFYTSS